jgi:hypothetical protein
MSNTEQYEKKRRAVPIAEVYTADGLMNLGAVYRWNTGEEEIFWDDHDTSPPKDIRTINLA